MHEGPAGVNMKYARPPYGASHTIENAGGTQVKLRLHTTRWTRTRSAFKTLPTYRLREEVMFNSNLGILSPGQQGMHAWNTNAYGNLDDIEMT